MTLHLRSDLNLTFGEWKESIAVFSHNCDQDWLTNSCQLTLQSPHRHNPQSFSSHESQKNPQVLNYLEGKYEFYLFLLKYLLNPLQRLKSIQCLYLKKYGGEDGNSWWHKWNPKADMVVCIRMICRYGTALHIDNMHYADMVLHCFTYGWYAHADMVLHCFAYRWYADMVLFVQIICTMQIWYE